MSLTIKSFNIIAVTAAALLLANPAAAGRCSTVQFSGAAQQPAANMPFIGTIDMVDLYSGELRSADIATMLLGAVSADGSRVVTSHEVSGTAEVEFSFVTFDDAQLLPTDVPGTFSLTSHMRLKTGQGPYNCGELVIDGQASTVSFDGRGVGSASYAGFGRLCRCRPADN